MNGSREVSVNNAKGDEEGRRNPGLEQTRLWPSETSAQLFRPGPFVPQDCC